MFVADAGVLERDAGFPDPLSKPTHASEDSIVCAHLPWTPMSWKLFSRFFLPGVLAGAMVYCGLL